MKHGARVVTAVLLVLAIVALLPAAVALAGTTNTAAKSPKNIIIMISDGMGFNHMTATDYYQYGRENAQTYEKYPVKLAMSTYAYVGSAAPFTLWQYDPVLAWADFSWIKLNPTDSASAATAMATGTKTYNAAINWSIDGQPLSTMSERAEEMGKSTGVVTTVEWSHATPAGWVAHNPNRNNYEAIAREMINDSATDVIMGAGNPWFNDNGQVQAVAGTYKYVGGLTTWDALTSGTAGSDADGDGVADPWSLIQTRDEFLQLMSGPTPDRVCGTAQVATTTQQARTLSDKDAAPYTDPLNAGVPTLAEMTKGALNVLGNDPDGFLVMIEGGAVDWAGHANQIGRMIEEQIDFNKAVAAVEQWVKANSNWGETLLIVTADHETGDLWGPNAGTDPNDLWPSISNNHAACTPGYSWNSGDHTNSLVPLFTKGAGANEFKKMVVGKDPVRGRYIDNTAIGTLILDLLN